ncbi:MAG: hypothetical protein KTV45_09945 [Acidimicrobiia bacterium]|nr:hypothetical protein [Acidimicrobiia bacterium]
MALALHLKVEGHSVCVVTEDVVDRIRILIATACRRLDIDWCPVRKFLRHCGIPLLNRKEE